MLITRLAWRGRGGATDGMSLTNLLPLSPSKKHHDNFCSLPCAYSWGKKPTDQRDICVSAFVQRFWCQVQMCQVRCFKLSLVHCCSWFLKERLRGWSIPGLAQPSVRIFKKNLEVMRMTIRIENYSRTLIILLRLLLHVDVSWLHRCTRVLGIDHQGKGRLTTTLKRFTRWKFTTLRFHCSIIIILLWGGPKRVTCKPFVEISAHTMTGAGQTFGLMCVCVCVCALRAQSSPPQTLRELLLQHDSCKLGETEKKIKHY